LKVRTHKEFVSEIYIINSNIEILGQYTKAINKIHVKCLVCGNEWNPTANSLLNNHGCSVCAYKEVSLLLKYSQETYNKKVFDLVGNNIIVVDEYINSISKIDFKCNICNQAFQKTPRNFLENSSCPICKGSKCVKGINDLWTTNPEIAILLLNHDDGYKYTINNKKIKLDWKCFCGNIIRGRTLYYVILSGLVCYKCSDGISYPNKFMFNLLKQLNIEYECEKSFRWSNHKKYDDYIRSINCIIENHGDGHYTHKIKWIEDFDEQIKNDNFKEIIAIENGIEHYIIIDARNSELEWIKNSILNSELAILFDLSNINWSECHKYALNSIVFDVCEMYNNNFLISEIANKYKLNKKTISRYLKRGNDANLCNYVPKENLKKSVSYRKAKSVICITTGERFNTITQASQSKKIGAPTLIDCLKGRKEYAGKLPSGEKLKWQYA
jgi:predicted DNA-binding protein YlxM (UPF0122 family)